MLLEWPPYLENVISSRVEYHDALVEVVVLHGGGWVEDGQGRHHFGLEGVVGAPVVKVVAQAGHQQSENLQKKTTKNKMVTTTQILYVK